MCTLEPRSRAPAVSGIETLTARPALPSDMSDDVVDPEKVRHVADLARVDLDDEEVERFTEQFADILDSFDSLDAVPEVDRAAELDNVMRTDEPHDSLSQDEALQNAPESEAGHFKGPRVS